jgi:drug/metabolite transporter (DMT)-like permease
MEPVYGIILAIIILNENSQLSIEFYIGFIIIFISVILNGIIKLRKNKII